MFQIKRGYSGELLWKVCSYSHSGQTLLRQQVCFYRCMKKGLSLFFIHLFLFWKSKMRRDRPTKKEIEQYLIYMISTYVDVVYGVAESGDDDRIKKI